jgi:hypothetical protein
VAPAALTLRARAGGPESGSPGTVGARGEGGVYGGGGGYYGGGACSPGAGASSFVPANATSVVETPNYNDGPGGVTISW